MGRVSLPLSEVGAERLADDFLGADEVEAVVVNLIGGAEFHAVAVEPGFGFGIEAG